MEPKFGAAKHFIVKCQDNEIDPGRQVTDAFSSNSLTTMPSWMLPSAKHPWMAKWCATGVLHLGRQWPSTAHFEGCTRCQRTYFIEDYATAIGGLLAAVMQVLDQIYNKAMAKQSKLFGQMMELIKNMTTKPAKTLATSNDISKQGKNIARNVPIVEAKHTEEVMTCAGNWNQMWAKI